MNLITNEILNQLLSIAVDRASSLLRDEIDDTKRILNEIDNKLEAYGFQGEYRTACDHLKDARFIHEEDKKKKLESSLYLFELSSNRVGALSEEYYQTLGDSMSFMDAASMFRTSRSKKIEYEVRVYKKTNQYLMYERIRFLCLFGALKAAISLNNKPLIHIKKTKILDSLIRFPGDLANSKLNEMLSGQWYESSGILTDLPTLGMQPWKLGVLLEEVISGESGDHELNFEKSIYNARISELRSIRMWSQT